ncbi:unnamed protein product [Linum trigynum]|uniref:F-box associated beta-propeller type 1 domain-containing protein n=1 Tax=Linum trigynum TaxID=586398 RepID=A0AAV2FG10_9ROSI
MPNSKRRRTLAAEIPKELIAAHILPKVTDGACLGRCRCICRSWRDLLSGPSLLRQHKLQRPPDSTSSSSSSDDYQIMVTGFHKQSSRTYRLHSAETLEPLLPTPNSTTMLLPSTGNLLEVVGCCKGLLCLFSESYSYFNGHVRELILWNPATSESKLLPDPPSRPHDDLVPVGFGFDSETNDYKVFRQVGRDHYFMPPYLMEVYSLRKDSWRISEGRYYPRVPRQPVPTYHEGKLYWSEPSKKSLRFYSIDVSSEACDTIDVPFPAAVSEGWGRVSGYPGYWFTEESMVARFPFHRDTLSMEIWMLMQCWLPESWVKLYVITPPPAMRIMEFTGLASSLTCFFAEEKDGAHYRDRIVVFDLETGESNGFEIEGQSSVHAITYTPSQVSLRE